MNYYDDKYNDGHKFEEYVVNELKEEGITITLTKSFKDQIEIGESFEGYEIKFDDKLKETGNLWIETHERRNKDKEYVKSGIFRDDNTIKYIIGDYLRIFIFDKETLKDLVKQKEIKENNRKTSKGFLLSTIEAFDYAERIIDKFQIKLEDYL